MDNHIVTATGVPTARLLECLVTNGSFTVTMIGALLKNGLAVFLPRGAIPTRPPWRRDCESRPEVAKPYHARCMMQMDTISTEHTPAWGGSGDCRPDGMQRRHDCNMGTNLSAGGLLPSPDPSFGDGTPRRSVT